MRGVFAVHWAPRPEKIGTLCPSGCNERTTLRRATGSAVTVVRVRQYTPDKDNIPLECQGTERADFAGNFTLQFGPKTKQTYADLRYWGPSAFLVAKEAIFGVPNGQHPICTEWKDLNLRVELDQAGGNYSWMVEAPRTEVPYGHAWPRIARPFCLHTGRRWPAR